MTDTTPTDLEQRGWAALAASPEEAVAFYRLTLDREATLLLPGGTVLTGTDTILTSMSGQPWSSYRLAGLRQIDLAAQAAVVTYSVQARRDGDPDYAALVSSTYARRENGWKLVLHQQTPC